MLDIFLDVKPFPKQRPRVGKFGNVYTPDKTVICEKEIAALIKSFMNRNCIKMTASPVCVKLVFNYSYPSKLNSSQKVLKDIGMLYKRTRPDLDNLCKLVMDAMNNLVFEDDSQVCKLICEKRYSDVEGISIQVVNL